MSNNITTKTALPSTLTSGDKIYVVRDGTDYVADADDFPGSGSGDVTAASSFGTDNAIIRADGTGKGVQSSGITIDDSDYLEIPSGGRITKATTGVGEIYLGSSGGTASIHGQNSSGSASFQIDSEGTAYINEIYIGQLVNAAVGRLYTASGFTANRSFNFPDASGTIALTSDITTPNEQDITGTRRTASVSSTDSLDWDAYSVFELTMTGNTTFSDSNLPTGTGVKVIEIILDGNFTATLPAYWEADPNNDTYDGSVRNRLLVSCINGTTSSEDVIYTLTNLAT